MCCGFYGSGFSSKILAYIYTLSRYLLRFLMFLKYDMTKSAVDIMNWLLYYFQSSVFYRLTTRRIYDAKSSFEAFFFIKLLITSCLSIIQFIMVSSLINLKSRAHFELKFDAMS